MDQFPTELIKYLKFSPHANVAPTFLHFEIISPVVSPTITDIHWGARSLSWDLRPFHFPPQDFIVAVLSLSLVIIAQAFWLSVRVIRNFALIAYACTLGWITLYPPWSLGEATLSHASHCRGFDLFVLFLQRIFFTGLSNSLQLILAIFNKRE